MYFDPVFTLGSTHEKPSEERSKKSKDQGGKIKED